MTIFHRVIKHSIQDSNCYCHQKSLFADVGERAESDAPVKFNVFWGELRKLVASRDTTRKKCLVLTTYRMGSKIECQNRRILKRLAKALPSATSMLQGVLFAWDGKCENEITICDVLRIVIAHVQGGRGRDSLKSH